MEKNNCTKASSNITRNDLEKRASTDLFFIGKILLRVKLKIKKLKMKHILKDSIIGKMTPQKE
jgi:hypothetical protein